MKFIYELLSEYKNTSSRRMSSLCYIYINSNQAVKCYFYTLICSWSYSSFLIRRINFDKLNKRSNSQTAKEFGSILLEFT